MGVRKKSLSYYILLALEKSVDGYIRFEDFANHYYRYHYGAPELEKSQFAQALKRLRERGLIRADKTDACKLVLKLTQLGQDALGLGFDEKNWDGKWRIVAFDIPENKRSVRRILRSRLKMWQFVPWQKSVWATKRNIMEKIKKIIQELEIEDWIAIIESNSVFVKNISTSDRV